MRKYIDAEQAVEISKKATLYGSVWVKRELEDMPAADVQEVRHGRLENIYGDNYKCSVCGAWYRSDEPLDFNYCPSCGARMDLDEVTERYCDRNLCATMEVNGKDCKDCPANGGR